MPKLLKKKSKDNKKKPSSLIKTATSKDPRSSENRPIKYDKVSVSLCTGDKAITGEQAMKLLGWHVETENAKDDGSKFGSGFDFKDTRDVKIQCLSNSINRILYSSLVDKLKQEVLRKRWKMNGEPVIISKYGSILNGQHSLIGLVFANQLWEDYREYRDLWPTPPTMEKLIVYGIEEDDETVNTMDTCKPRSLADVFYRSEFFKDVAVGHRKKLAKMAQFAVKEMWSRTGAADKHSKHQTHAESIDFINRHPKLLQCIKHIFEENGGKENKIFGFMGLGAASAAMYLMGSCKTEREQEDNSGYSDTPYPDESMLDWSMWDEASEFWVKLASGTKDLFPVSAVRAMLIEQGTYGTPDKMALIAKAWELWSGGVELDAPSITPAYQQDDKGYMVLAETPLFYGIDLGGPVPS